MVLKRNISYVLLVCWLMVLLLFYFLPLDLFGSYNVYGEFKGIRPLPLILILNSLIGFLFFAWGLTEKRYVIIVCGIILAITYPLLIKTSFFINYMAIQI